jgi:hypothetical protein
MQWSSEEGIRMAATIITKLHDTKITFKDIPTINDIPLLPADLVGCTLSFLLKDPSNPAGAIKKPAVINPDASFSYDPVAADVAIIGKFQQEWEVVYPTAKILTFPNGTYNIVKIIADLG